MDTRKALAFSGRIVMVGFGSIGQGALPLLLRHIDLKPEQITIVTGDENGRQVAAEYGVAFHNTPLTPANYRALLEPRLGRGDFLINCSTGVSSIALIGFCQERGTLYIDTCIEPWDGGYTDASIAPASRTNYALRETALPLKRSGLPTAVITHGANPGMISHLAKEALLNIARDTGHSAAAPKERAGWAQLARDLNIRVIHVAERDTQVAEPRKAPGEFLNTWSVEGFIGEGCQPAELGWGSHEKHFPADGRRHDAGSKAAIYLMRPGASTHVRTWTPLAGPIHGFLITHNESISLADYLSVGAGDNPAYRPTVHYAYHPCDDAVQSVYELASRNWTPQTSFRLVKDEIISGVDELGVLLMGHAKGAYWYGSRLGVEDARRLAPHNSATSLQVTAPVVAGVIWALRHPDRGVVEPEELDHDEIMDFIRPYLGQVAGAYSDWTPLQGREQLFAEDLDRDDPWQFKNFRVI
ncbi:MAG: saccharopine dehydrogenase NADP-binding domain-containing protein [Zoogloeaceae bacterium]|nr:saccharopine dehydrogenase NADP-binding domain-containing protein [Zoogloeaceae bacterium]